MSLVKQFKIGAIVRYSSGITALMKVETVYYDEDGEGNHRYYGMQFYGATMAAYHNDIFAAKPAEVALWDEHWKKEKMVKTARVAITAINDALNNLPAKGECRTHLAQATLLIQLAVEEAQR
jgi:hypothetical protein